MVKAPTRRRIKIFKNLIDQDSGSCYSKINSKYYESEKYIFYLYYQCAKLNFSAIRILHDFF